MVRRYQSHDGRWWTVEAVHPSERGRVRDRRMAAGWLRYRSDCGDSVCVAPIPPRWTSCDVEHLEALRMAGRYAGYSDVEA
jgi:hypothetical protein